MNLRYYKLLDFRQPHNFEEFRIDDLICNFFEGDVGPNDLICEQTSDKFQLIRNHPVFREELMLAERPSHFNIKKENWKIKINDIWIHKRLFYTQRNLIFSQAYEAEKLALLDSIAMRLTPKLFHDEELFTLFQSHFTAGKKRLWFFQKKIAVIVAITDLRLFQISINQHLLNIDSFIWEDVLHADLRESCSDNFKLTIKLQDSIYHWDRISGIDFAHIKRLLPGLIFKK